MSWPRCSAVRVLIFLTASSLVAEKLTTEQRVEILRGMMAEYARRKSSSLNRRSLSSTKARASSTKTSGRKPASSLDRRPSRRSDSGHQG